MPGAMSFFFTMKGNYFQPRLLYPRSLSLAVKEVNMIKIHYGFYEHQSRITIDI